VAEVAIPLAAGSATVIRTLERCDKMKSKPRVSAARRFALLLPLLLPASMAGAASTGLHRGYRDQFVVPYPFARTRVDHGIAASGTHIPAQ